MVKLNTKAAILVSSALAVAAIGVMCAGPAFASSSAEHLCTSSGCAFSQGATNDVLKEPSTTPHLTNWYYPTGGNQQFRQADTNLCITAGLNGQPVFLATCGTLGTSQQFSPDGKTFINTKLGKCLITSSVYVEIGSCSGSNADWSE